MDPRHFIKLTVSNIAVRLKKKMRKKKKRFACEIRLPGFSSRASSVAVIDSMRSDGDGGDGGDDDDKRGASIRYYLDEEGVAKLFTAPSSCFKPSLPCLEILLYNADDATAEWKIVGSLNLPLISSDLCANLPTQLHSGWMSIGRNGGEFHADVRVENDPRYVFQFDGDIALSPQIVQINSKMKTKQQQQPIFTCKFTRSRLGEFESRSFMRMNSLERENSMTLSSERKGWLVMIHDLSGFPVAAASMVTPFVPWRGSQRVSRSNPGVWLILRSEDPIRNEMRLVKKNQMNECSEWRAWGRLQAWNEKGILLGLNLQLLGGDGILISDSEALIPTHKSSKFTIDASRCSSSSSSSSSIQLQMGCAEGFVMSCKTSSSAPKKCGVQLSTKHIEDAAVFMALAAAVDLSRDACKPFTRKLRKELL